MMVHVYTANLLLDCCLWSMRSAVSTISRISISQVFEPVASGQCDMLRHGCQRLSDWPEAWTHPSRSCINLKTSAETTLSLFISHSLEPFDSLWGPDWCCCSLASYAKESPWGGFCIRIYTWLQHGNGVTIWRLVQQHRNFKNVVCAEVPLLC